MSTGPHSLSRLRRHRPAGEGYERWGGLRDFSNFLEVQTATPWGRTLARFAAFCRPRPGARILDVGCGPGLLPALFREAGCRVCGVELDRGLLRTPLAPGLACADGYRLPFATETFDLLAASNTLFLLADPAGALREWARALRPGGALCLLNPSGRLSVVAAAELAGERGLQGSARESLLNWAAHAEAHNRWTEAETRGLLESAGLEAVESELAVGPGFARFTRAVRIGDRP